ncbi:MAG: hypothetical protein ACYC0V_08480 [Armatimonadota bacterium]
MSRIVIETAKNLCEDNNILNLPCDQDTKMPIVGGISICIRPKSWVRDKEQIDCELAEFAGQHILPFLDRKIWIFFFTSSEHPNRITRYKRLWKDLWYDDDLDTSKFLQMQEIEIVHDDMVSYAGVGQITTDEFTSMIHYIRKHRSYFIVLSHRDSFPDKANITRLYEAVYSNSIYGALIPMLCPIGDVVVRLPDIYDTPPYPYEQSLDFILSSDELPALIEHAKKSI